MKYFQTDIKSKAENFLRIVRSNGYKAYMHEFNPTFYEIRYWL